MMEKHYEHDKAKINRQVDNKKDQKVSKVTRIDEKQERKKLEKESKSISASQYNSDNETEVS